MRITLTQGPKLTFLGRPQLATEFFFVSRQEKLCGRQKVVNKTFPSPSSKQNYMSYLLRIITKRTPLAIFPQTNKIKYKHADFLIYINPWKTTSNESNAGHTRSFVRLLNVSSELYTFSCARLKNCHLVLCSMFKTMSKRSFLSRSVKSIDRSPCCSHQATTVQHFSL